MLPNKNMSGCEKNRYHEAGHVFIIRFVGIDILYAYSECKEGTAGATYISGKSVPSNVDELKSNRPHDLCMIAVAGAVAQRLASGSGTMSQEDENWARPSAYNAINARNGFDGISDDDEDCKSRLIDEYIRQTEEEVKSLLNQDKHWSCIQRIAKRLSESRINGNSEVDNLIF